MHVQNSQIKGHTHFNYDNTAKKYIRGEHPYVDTNTTFSKNVKVDGIDVKSWFGSMETRMKNAESNIKTANKRLDTTELLTNSNTYGFCCFQEHPDSHHKGGRKMCLPAGNWDLWGLGHNDLISGISCQGGVHARLYEHWYSGNSVYIANNAKLGQKELDDKKMQDKGTSLVIRSTKIDV